MNARNDHRRRVAAGATEAECWAALFDEIDRLRAQIEAMDPSRLVCKQVGCTEMVEKSAGYDRCREHDKAWRAWLRSQPDRYRDGHRERAIAEGREYCHANVIHGSGPCTRPPYPSTKWCPVHAPDDLMYAWKYGFAVGQLGIAMGDPDLYVNVQPEYVEQLCPLAHAAGLRAGWSPDA